MKTPVATYRLQFRGDMDFEAALEIVPYLKQLGVSHLYASPLFAATSGSTHGYDVTDHNEIDSVLGGWAGFERLSDRLKAEGLGLLLDIVPNHMAASMENPWWRDVVEWGEQSRYARHFDIDWSRKLTLPILGRPFGEALAEGELSLILDVEGGGLAMSYFDNRIPLHPASWQGVLAKIDHPVAARLAQAAGLGDPAQPEELRDAVRETTRADGELAKKLAALSRDHGLISALHDEQPWQLMFWKEARRTLSYRRFFEITGLAGVRVEDRAVFDDVHRLTLELVRSGRVDGLRIDHVDGLADPASYLHMLREAVGPDVYLVVEKILAPDELLPADWPIQGTTGYEFVDATVDLLADAEGLEKLARAYETDTGAPDLHSARRTAKREIATINFEGELHRLADILTSLSDRRFDIDSVRHGLAALIVAMPVYRTYVGAEAASAADREAFDRATEELGERDPEVAADLIAFLRDILIERDPADDETARARRLFQQLSSPAMAKGVEDTLFYRDHRLLALNEVGCEPERPRPSLERFHRLMDERQSRHPLSLTATATHDTKRGEDARARLFSLTGAPEEWAQLVARWRAANSGLVRKVEGKPAPEPELEWMIYQALMAAWPEGLDADDGDGIATLRARFLEFLEKAVREAKLRTTWTNIGAEYESAVRAYAEGLLEPGSAFLSDFVRKTQTYRAAGRRNALSQLLVKLTAPGIPDIYQGTETGDFSLVDPDNRRPVDFGMLREMLTARQNEGDTFSALKMDVLAAGLAARNERADLFTWGQYLPLQVRGSGAESLLAYARLHKGDAALVLVPRLAGELSADARHWGDTRIELPPALAEGTYRDVLSGRSRPMEGGRLMVADWVIGPKGALLLSW
ncbi:malto-oligosyltrehalose synthase [Chelativorans sp. ZYF759]|uniref:malto-oligosyltrehalose synthase n=1 Tax=Chelativorans sp. ZYF759 TaxID=2692213 RepID=UPI00145F0FFC|nr:malto-oligosyltrehalose synthase [Chelativorans sp. ZYF759]NMG37827.1 malto-oligosyltrehalose synthase [Chelativorans sp. ZYF759]